MLRSITGFHQDDVGDWVAELACHHRQHVRHRPPFFDRPWVEDDEQRAARVGTDLDCPLCDRTELPDDLAVVRTAGPFDDTTIPPGLRRDHRVADGVWGRLRVLDGAVRVTVATDPPVDVVVEAGGEQALPPAVSHAVHVIGPTTIAVDFLKPPTPPSPPTATPAD